MEALLDIARGAGCAWSRTRRRASARPSAAGRSARSATRAASASTRRRTSPAARAARSRRATRSSRSARRSCARRAPTARPSSAARWTSTPGSPKAAATCCRTCSRRSSTRSSTSSPRSRRGARAVAARYRAGLADWADARRRAPARRLPEREPQPPHLLPAVPGRRRARDACWPRSARAACWRRSTTCRCTRRPTGEASAADAGRCRSPTAWRRTLLRLPLHPRLADGDVDRVIEAVRRRGGLSAGDAAPPEPGARLLQRGGAPRGRASPRSGTRSSTPASRSRSSSSTT